MKHIKTLLRGVPFMQSLESRTLLSAGDLNLNFGGGSGQLLFAPPAGAALATSLATQPDGKFVLASGSAQWSAVWLERLDAKGNPDKSFGSNGVVTQTIHNLVSARDIQRQSDGKFVVVGTTTSGGFIARFTSSGKLDTTFGGGDGVTFTSSFLRKVTILPNGKIAAASSSRVIRLKSNGSIDTSFGKNGSFDILPAVQGLTRFDLSGIAAQKDNKIVIDGTATLKTSATTTVGVLRITSSGKADATFDGDGFKQMQFSADDSDNDVSAIGIAVDSTGRIIVGGDDGTGYAGVLKSNGAQQFVISTGLASGSGINAISVDSKDRILLAGYFDYGMELGLNFAVKRYSPSGANDIDADLLFDGPVNGFPRDDSATAVQMGGDGNIIVVGTSIYNNADKRIAIASVQGNPGGPAAPTLPISTDPAGDFVFTGTSGNDTIGIYDWGEDSWIDFNGYISEYFLTGQPNFVINGAGGNDHLTFTTSQDDIHVTLNGGSGNDTLSSDAQANVLSGGSGNDSLTGSDGTDALLGGDGDDTLDGGLGDDYLDGGAGTDTVDYSYRTTPITAQITLSSPTYIVTGDGGEAGENDSYFEIEKILGGSSDDKLSMHCGNFPHGTTRNFALVGNDGNDTLTVDGSPLVDRRSHVTVDGGNGNDWITVTAATVQVLAGADGDDLDLGNAASTATVSGDMGSGDDWEHFFVAPDSGTPSITLLPGCENFQGTGSMIVTGNDLDNVFTIGYQQGATTQVFGMGGNDGIIATRAGDECSLIVDGGDGNDSLNGGDGNDTLTGGNGNDEIDGWGGDDKLYGNDGNDTIYGGTGNDTLDGGAGRDSLLGEDGNDTLFAKDGRTDTLDGGNGTDTAQRDNSSTIKDLIFNIESFI